MDVFSDLVRGVRSHGSRFGVAVLSPPWALRFDDGAPLTLCALLSGSGWVLPQHGPPERVGARETVVVRGPATFALADDPAAAGDAVPWRPGRAAPGSAPAGASTLVVGAYPARGEISRRLLDDLPAVLRVGGGESDDPVLDHLAAEVAVEAPGQQAVLDRLLDWLLVCTLRTWFDRPGGRPPRWWSAQRDPVVGEALRLLHTDPAAPWTVASLAARTGVSRSTLAERFTDRVGEPPVTYLTRWRMTLAADLLLERPEATVAQVARRVGYADPFAFSAAFRRVRGTSPSGFRRAVEDPEDAGDPQVPGAPQRGWTSAMGPNPSTSAAST
ncbi:cupin domain-containing protein [Kineococcus sp. SYSU DK004]|uniref:cupin domain-containing protein n=1 Tax=Kineococcus sp. SYSU DK004 TaxID=3383125 RepID=UPI003D7C4717